MNDKKNQPSQQDSPHSYLASVPRANDVADVRHILQSAIPVHIELDRFRSDELKRAARFWVGKEAIYYKKEKCIAALTQIMNGDDDARSALTGLSEKEREILAIFTRYGPTVSGGHPSNQVGSEATPRTIGLSRIVFPGIRNTGELRPFR
jgi:hypothetical protein